ncbi:MAG: D-aminopeptidase [Turneriella sp.]|nr:D-aminopeptidase [Turneriella sp.]
MRHTFDKLFFLVLFFLLQCKSDPIKDRPISFSPWRKQQTINYIRAHYGTDAQDIKMLPVMVVSHYTAMDSTDVSFEYMNKEEMEAGRKVLKDAGLNNIAVHFLVGKDGTIYRLMPENHIGRHVIGLNRHAIGIENVGKDESALTQAQVDANAYIVRELVKKYPIHYLIAHSEYRNFEKTPLWEEKDDAYRTKKIDPGESFMRSLREKLKDLNLKSQYDGSELYDRLGYTLDNYFRKGEFEGNALIIFNGKTILDKAYGKQKITDAIYLASAAKPISAAAVYALISEKKLSLKTPVAPYFPKLKKILPNVQVRHLLNHTSGIEDYYKLTEEKGPFTNSAVLAFLETMEKPLFKAGKKFYYANSNYILLAELIEKITNKKFTEYVREKIFIPAKMETSFFVTEIIPEKKIITATTASGDSFLYPHKTVGAGGLYATTGDLARFGMALNQDVFFNHALFLKMVEPSTSVEQKKTQYASGWYVYPKQGIIYHDGNFNGYHTINYLEWKKKNAIILLARRSTNKIKEITYELGAAINGRTAKKLE